MLQPNVHQCVNKHVIAYFNVALIFFHSYTQMYFNVIKGKKYDENEDKNKNINKAERN
jgi:hypothetical protein